MSPYRMAQRPMMFRQLGPYPAAGAAAPMAGANQRQRILRRSVGQGEDGEAPGQKNDSWESERAPSVQV